MRESLLIASFLLVFACQPSEVLFAVEAPAALSVTRGSFQNSIRISGILRAADSETIASPDGAWGVAIRWMAEDGTLLQKGEKVIEIDNTAVTSSLETNKAELVRAQNELAQQRNTGQINVAEKEHLLRQAEFAMQKAALDAAVPKESYPRRVYEDMQLSLTQAKSAHADAVEALATEQKVMAYALVQKEIALEKARRNIEKTRKQLKLFVLTAPRDGLLVVSENWRDGRPYQVGDSTWPGMTIAEIPNLSVMRVEATLSDVDDGRIHVGMETRCILDAHPDVQFTGHIRTISPVAQAPQWRSLRRVFRVEIELAETNPERMRPGMSVQVEVLDKARENVLLAPRESLLFDKGQVFALLNGGARQLVELGPCSHQQCVIESGLEEGKQLARRHP